MADLEATLKKKLGPLPTWVWLVGIGGGFFIARRLRSGGAPPASGDASASVDTSSGSDLAGAGYDFPVSGAPGVGSGGSSSGGFDAGPPFTPPVPEPPYYVAPAYDYSQTAPAPPLPPDYYAPPPESSVSVGSNEPPQKTATQTAPPAKNYCFEWGGKKWGKAYPGAVAFKSWLTAHGASPKLWAQRHPDAARCLGVYQAWTAAKK